MASPFPRNTLTLPLPWLSTAKSWCPSPLKSPVATEATDPNGRLNGTTALLCTKTIAALLELLTLELTVITSRFPAPEP